jgi:hypothetical protein
MTTQSGGVIAAAVIGAVAVVGVPVITWMLNQIDERKTAPVTTFDILALHPSTTPVTSIRTHGGTNPPLPQPHAIAPPIVECLSTCKRDDCPRFQIAAGAGLGELLASAKSFRTNISPPYCAEVFYAPQSKNGPYVLTLGALDETTGTRALADIRAAKLWKPAVWSVQERASYGVRIYPPRCNRATITTSGCGDTPPSDTGFDGTAYRWNQDGRACSCMPDSAYEERWKAQGRCAKACWDARRNCELANLVDGGGNAAPTDCEQQELQCEASCPAMPN